MEADGISRTLREPPSLSSADTGMRGIEVLFELRYSASSISCGLRCWVALLAIHMVNDSKYAYVWEGLPSAAQEGLPDAPLKLLPAVGCLL